MNNTEQADELLGSWAVTSFKDLLQSRLHVPGRCLRIEFDQHHEMYIHDGANLLTCSYEIRGPRLIIERGPSTTVGATKLLDAVDSEILDSLFLAESLEWSVRGDQAVFMHARDWELNLSKDHRTGSAVPGGAR